MARSASGGRVPQDRDDDHGADGEERDEFKDLDRFWTSAHDEQGHSVEKHVRIQPGLDRQVAVIIQRRVFPYETFGDFARHALVRHIRYLHQVAERVPVHFLSGLALIDARLRDEDFHHRMEETLKGMEEAVDRHLAHGDHGEAMRLLAFCQAKMDEMEESSWRRRLLSKFRERYAKYLTPTTGVDVEFDEED